MEDLGQEINLVSLLDDYCRFESIFHDGLEAEFLKFVQSRGRRHLQWQQAKEDLRSLKQEHEMTLQELAQWKTNFAEMRSKYQKEQKQKEDLENQLTDLVKLLCEIKGVVDRDSSLPDQTKERFAVWQNYNPFEPNVEQELADRSMDFDKSGEVLDFEVNPTFSPGKKRSSHDGLGFLTVDFTVPKRHRLSLEVQKENEVHIEVDSVPVPMAKHAIYKQESVPMSSPMIDVTQVPTGKRRSYSEPEAIIFPETELAVGLRPDTNSVASVDKSCMPAILSSFVQQELSNSVKKSFTPRVQNTSNQPLRHNSGSKLSSRAHDFASKTVFRQETCLPCGRRIKFSQQALKCHTCRVTCHPACRSSVPLPCVPMERTPKRTGKTVSDFAPVEPPRIPAIIVLCVSELETRGMSEVGLYRLSASEREITSVKEKFTKGKGLPNLANVDVHVLCGTVKNFLRHLEPLIPKLAWEEFASAAAITCSQECQAALYQYIVQLPQPNRDTLAFLILHWQRVAESQKTKMTIKNLAMVLGPTVVGNFTPSGDPGVLIEEQAIQVKIMEKLLMIPTEFWKNEQEISLLGNPGSVIASRSVCVGSSQVFSSPRGRLVKVPVPRRERLFTSPKV